jgi:biotin carboxyl carrier protein
MADKNQSFIVKSNGFEFVIDRSEIDATDIIRKSPTEFNIISSHRSANARLIEESGKKFLVEVESQNYDVEIKDAMDQMVDQMGFSKNSAIQLKEIKAPMPGMVMSIHVKEGDEVAEGERLLILVAMKMENSITVNIPVKIKKVLVEAGQAVEKGQKLFELE